MIRYLIFTLVALLVAADAIALEVPYLSGRVNDYAELITADMRKRLETRLQELEQKTGAQLVVLTVPGLESDSLEDFSIRVVETWQLGQRGTDNGILILVVRDDRKIRIEVGYGLEATITDLASRRVIDYLMVPAFREGNYEGGIEAAVNAIAGAVEGDESAIPAEGSEQNDLLVIVIFLAVFALFIAPFAFFALALPGSGGWFLYVFLIPFFGLFPMVAGSTVALIVAGLWIVVGGFLRLTWPDKWKIRSDGEGFTGGWKSSGSGWSSGSSSSGGGFSGGGGSFGGGGASGGW